MSWAQTLKGDFEQWARLAAKLRLCTPAQREQLLARWGLSETWHAINETWARTLNEEIGGNHLARPMRYKELCVEEAELMTAALSSFREELSPFAVLPAGTNQNLTVVALQEAGPATVPASPKPGLQNVLSRLSGRFEQRRRVVPPAREQADTIDVETLQPPSSSAPSSGFREELTPQGQVQPPSPGQDQTANTSNHRIKKIDEAMDAAPATQQLPDLDSDS